MRKTSTSLGLTLLILVAATGCAGSKVLVPPRIDLTPHEMIGVIDFSSSTQGELGPLTTRRFTEASRRDQGLVRMVSLGSEQEVLRKLRAGHLDAEAFRALGREQGLRTVLVGTLTVSDVRPDLRLAGLSSGSLSAVVDATLEVQLIETSTGASIWNRSSNATQSVAHVSILRGKDFVFDARDPDKAYGTLVSSLVEQVTREFRASWARR